MGPKCLIPNCGKTTPADSPFCHEHRSETAHERITEALDLAFSYGGIDGGHHKMWVIDKMVQALTGDRYEEWIKKFCDGEDGPETYSWDKGIAP